MQCSERIRPGSLRFENLGRGTLWRGFVQDRIRNARGLRVTKLWSEAIRQLKLAAK